MQHNNSDTAVRVVGFFPLILKRLMCWWFGCVPDYEAVRRALEADSRCRSSYPDAVPCSRCGAMDTDYADRIGDTRSRRVIDWLSTRRSIRCWRPKCCPMCRKRYRDCDCLPF